MSRNTEASRDEVLQVRVSEGLKQSVRIESAKNDQSMAEYMRSLIREDTGHSGGESDE